MNPIENSLDILMFFCMTRRASAAFGSEQGVES
jgi:hypothetical protein